MLEHNKHEFYHDVIHCLISALDYRDHYTKGHSNRVGDMALIFADLLDLDHQMKELIHISGHLHDIGKIGVADHILNKEGELSDIEWAEMKKHPQIGADVVNKCNSLKEVAEIIEQHHERWDGKGYPNGLIGNQIHIAARILAVCDSIDAMSSCRPYRKPFTWDFIRQEMKKNIGSQFDPELVKYFDKLIDIWIETYEKKTAI